MILLLLYCYIITISSLITSIYDKEYKKIILLGIVFIVEIIVSAKVVFNKSILSLLGQKYGFFNMKQLSIYLLLFISFIVGICLIYFGIKNQNELKEKSKDYLETEGYYTSYSTYGESDTHKLIYTYEVDGKEYNISTDYGAMIIPKENSTKIIKYDKNNPEEAIIEGINRNNIDICLGAVFIIISIALSISHLKRLKKVLNN